jgi:phage gpG-like protein
VPDVVVKVDAGKVTMALAQFRLGIEQRAELMQTLGAGQLESIYQTFAETGSPAGSWPPLSPNSLRWNRKYSSAHQLLKNSGRGINSIGATVSGDSVSIGTNLFYMAIQQRGFNGTQNVAPYSYTRRVKSRDTFGRTQVTNKLGRKQTVRRKLSTGVTRVNVNAFTRHLHIPARPFLVFRPEDPQRISEEVSLFLVERARQAGLEAN